MTAKVRTYLQAPAALLEYDERAPLVAQMVAGWIVNAMPSLIVEHVGSTSIPACPGKGVVDLMVLYRVGTLAAARDTLDALGFQRQGGRDPFPEERPMRIGAIDYAGKEFRLHAHVLAADASEVADFRNFRDRLRADAELVAAYAARKRQILQAGTTDPIDYCLAKGGFCEAVLGRS